MPKFKFGSIILLGRLSAILPTLIFLNLFFGWIFFGFYNWLLIGLALVFLFLINIALFAKTFKMTLSKPEHDKDVIDIEGKALGDEQLDNKAYEDSISCPHCNSYETRFVGPHDEMSEYECLRCGLRFEVEA